jgi:hypothetical protein
MSKVYSIHLIALKAGVSWAEFERFYRDEFSGITPPRGMAIRLLKGDRGDRAGRYAMMFEFESESRRTELYPEAGPAAKQLSEEFMQFMGAVAPSMQRWDQFATPLDVIYTDYVEV